MFKSLCVKNNIFGQTLLELIIALGVLVTGILSVLTLTKSSQVAVGVSSGHLIASNLAREGIEVVRALRDSNWLLGLAWDQGLSSGADTTAVPSFNPATRVWALNFGPNDLAAGRIYIDSAGVYNHSDTGAATNFYRLITINSDGTDYMKKVICQVRWFERGRQHDIGVEDWLYDWR